MLFPQDHPLVVKDRKERVERAASKDYDDAKLLVRPLEDSLVTCFFFCLALCVTSSHFVGFHLAAQAAESSEAKATLALEALEDNGIGAGLSLMPKL